MARRSEDSQFSRWRGKAGEEMQGGSQGGSPDALNLLCRILFVCHGNICRSPMAEFIMKDLVARAGVADAFVIASAAAQDDDLGCDLHRGARRTLDAHGVPHEPHAARLIRRSDLEAWDLIVCMDDENVRDVLRGLGPAAARKTVKLLSFAGSDADVADPWYTGDFEEAYQDIDRGCRALLEQLLKGSDERSGASC